MSNDLDLDELERQVQQWKLVALTMSKEIVLKLIALARQAERYKLPLREIASCQLCHHHAKVAREALEEKL